MSFNVPLFPEAASTMAAEVDNLYFGLLTLCGGIFVAVVATMIFFVIKYRKGSPANRDNIPTHDLTLEITWSIVPLFLMLIIFGWGAKMYYRAKVVPENAIEIYATPKQWMWKFTHPNGRREIDELHVPRGSPVKITMVSLDVIHSFFVPEFRIKQDALPGRYTTTWFTATKAGTYQILCSQYCGLNHSKMIGKVQVLEPAEYARWLSSAGTYKGGSGSAAAGSSAIIEAAVQASTGSTERSPLSAAGAQTFQKLGCASCHANGSAVQAPPLEGVFGHEVELEGGKKLIADETYLRNSILKPQSEIVKGYASVMPSFQGMVSEEELTQLIAYLKDLGKEGKK